MLLAGPAADLGFCLVVVAVFAERAVLCTWFVHLVLRDPLGRGRDPFEGRLLSGKVAI